ncbi:ATP-dependent RecD-like DNA helicase [Microbacterium sp. SS28]|uniref:ATP-dependent DNA helicase n=1 Tax=Microbacterium sp. SS28 TaxID=2919948 RepID=UPI001FAAD3A9|nr:DEAD/DEAH box helicase [Microbacterium sp. SS28]
MSNVDTHIRDIDTAICENIDGLSGNRALLAQNVLQQLRHLVEGVAVRLQSGNGTTNYDYAAITAGLAWLKGKGQLAFLSRFYRMLEPSVSHYTFDGDGSERLMLKYYEYLLRVRALLRDQCGIDVLANLEKFPIDQDPSLREYHEKIAARIQAVSELPADQGRSDRYYVLKSRPFFVDGRIYYEVTFTAPVDRVSKFDRVIAFTDIDIDDKYAARLMLLSDSIEVIEQTMPIMVIRSWEVSIRPCELEKLGRIYGSSYDVSSTSTEYRQLMEYLTRTNSSLVDMLELPDGQYDGVKAWATARARTPRLFPTFDAARQTLRSSAPGHIVLRYLLLRLKNSVLVEQFNPDGCARLSGLKLQWGCIPFDEMPFCTSLPGHNPRFRDLLELLDPSARTHELLAHRVRSNVDDRGLLYTPLADLAQFGDVAAHIEQFNCALYRTHQARRLEVDRGHVFIRGYEDDTVEIINKIQERASSGVGGWEEAVRRWLDERPGLIDDTTKSDALVSLFADSHVALIYGAAGTGKSTMVNYIANYFNDGRTLFLANTHSAVDNLKRRVQAQHPTFRTVASQIWSGAGGSEYDLVVIDECSTVSNSDLLKVLQATRFKVLVLVGDVYQIDSIQFGNWFGLARSFVPPSAVTELNTPFRTKNEGLLGLWKKVREIDEDITEAMTRGSYSARLSSELFQARRDDEIILCLNYDGLYGINNVNRFLQSSNPSATVEWGVSTYKVGDPVVFGDTNRFGKLIYNNLKGTITGIDQVPGKIRFEVDLHSDVTELSVLGSELEWVRDSVVAFDVVEMASSDNDNQDANTTVPFQVAYAVSIHRAQGLEYESVKIVITDANEEDTTHSIFYTAITRARENLKIFWTPETQNAIIANLERRTNQKDVRLLSDRRGLTPVA